MAANPAYVYRESLDLNHEVARQMLEYLPTATWEQTNKVYEEVAHDPITSPYLLRELCKGDRFYLLTVMMSRDDANVPYLYERCREVEANPDGHLDLWAREHYKLQSVENHTLTANGWKNHGALEVGDEVFTLNGQPTKIIARTPNWDTAACWQIIFTDGTEVICGTSHLWLVMEPSRRRQNYARINRWPAIRSTGYLAEIDHDKLARTGHRVAVPNNRPLEMPWINLPIEPYTLGAWLGDGTSANGRITCGDQIWGDIESEGYSLGPDRDKREHVSLRDVIGMAAQLRTLGLKNNKHVPPDYFHAHMLQRLALLQGLMDTDGHCNTRGTATFVNKNERLADAVRALAQSLGMNARKRRYTAYHGIYWQVSFQAYRSLPPFRLPRKIARCKEGQPWGYRYVAAVEPVAPSPGNCIQVADPSGMYLVGEELVPTHNSTIITFTGSIQEIINDPEITIGIFSHSKSIAKDFLVQIKTEIEQNRDLVALFSDIFWENSRKAPEWSVNDGITIKRTKNPREATVEANGLVDGLPTGKHYALCIYDDVVTERNVSTPEQIKRTTEAWELSLSLGRQAAYRSQYAATRYNYADTYQTILDRGSAIPRIHAATDDGMPDGKPLFMSEDSWAQKKKDLSNYILACQYLQNPLAGSERELDPEWIRYYEIRPLTLNVYITVDYAGSKKFSGSSRTAFAVIGVDSRLNKYLLDGCCHRMPLSERWRFLKYFWKKWTTQPGVQFVKIGYERYGAQSDIEHFEAMMLVEDDVDPFPIHEVNWPREATAFDKDSRIRRLEPDFRQWRFYFPYNGDETALQSTTRAEGHGFLLAKPILRRNEENRSYDLTQYLIDNEVLFFPATTHKDMLDAMSRIYDLEIKPPVIYDADELEPDYEM